MSKKYFIAVDDEQDLKLLFDHFFSKYVDEKSLELIFVNNAPKCIELLKTIDGEVLVLTDINMPLMNGIELLKKIQKSYPKTKVLLTSAYDESNYIDDMKENNAVGYISKPVDFNYLRSEVLKLLDIEQ